MENFVSSQLRNAPPINQEEGEISAKKRFWIICVRDIPVSVAAKLIQRVLLKVWVKMGPSEMLFDGLEKGTHRCLFFLSLLFLFSCKLPIPPLTSRG